MLLTINQNKSKVPGKMRKFWVYLSGKVNAINWAQAI